MKKIIFIILICLFLVGCENKGCNNEVVEFGHKGILTYYLDENPIEKLKELKLKVTSKGKETIFPLNDKSIKIDNFTFDKIGEYTANVIFNKKNYSLKYKVEIRKWDNKINTAWYNETKDNFIISTAQDLAGLAELVNKGNDFSFIVPCGIYFIIPLSNFNFIL